MGSVRADRQEPSRAPQRLPHTQSQRTELTAQLRRPEDGAPGLKVEKRYSWTERNIQNKLKGNQRELYEKLPL